MDDRQALVTLINAADFLSLKDQRRFSEAVSQLTDEEVKSMGKFFAEYLKAEEADLAANQKAIIEILERLA